MYVDEISLQRDLATKVAEGVDSDLLMINAANTVIGLTLTRLTKHQFHQNDMSGSFLTEALTHDPSDAN